MAVSPQATHFSSAAKKLTPRRFVKDVVLDPGIVFGVADVLLFAKTNPVGFIACLSATGLSVGLKTLHLAQPAFLKNYTHLADIAGDSRTALRVSGLALLTVCGASIASGALLPAATGFLLAVGNFRLAQSLSDAMEAHKIFKQREQEKKAAQESGAPVIEETPAPQAAVKMNWQQKTLQIATLSVKRPDLYINTGFAGAGLMAGGAALFILPVVAVSFAISMRNIVRALPEHNGHPKLLSSGASAGFAGIGGLEGQGLVAAAHVLNMAVMADAERQVTPGGWRQIGDNIRGTLAKVLRLDKPQEPLPVDHPIPVPFDAHDLGEDTAPSLPENGKLKQHFNVPVPEPKPQPAVAAEAAQNTAPAALNDNTAAAGKIAHPAPGSGNDNNPPLPPKAAAPNFRPRR
jgi:hypothetical protein